jgi:hypothetical protein
VSLFIADKDPFRIVIVRGMWLTGFDIKYRLGRVTEGEEEDEAMPAKKKPNITTRASAPRALSPLIAELRGLILSARHQTASTINTLQVLTNFEIGRRIVEHEQQGAKRAAYGAELLKELSARLTEEFGKGFSRSNLQNMRTFFLLWERRVPQICQQAIGKLGIEESSQHSAGEAASVEILHQSAGELLSSAIFQRPTGISRSTRIQQHPAVELSPVEISAQPARKSPFTLSWTHYVLLLGIKDPNERNFYEIEATSEGWSVPELRRQVASCLYERLALSRDKAGIKRLAQEGQLVSKPEDILKEPLVLEFLGMDEKAAYSESDLETAIINQSVGRNKLAQFRHDRITAPERQSVPAGTARTCSGLHCSQTPSLHATHVSKDPRIVQTMKFKTMGTMTIGRSADAESTRARISIRAKRILTNRNSRSCTREAVIGSGSRRRCRMIPAIATT